MLKATAVLFKYRVKPCFHTQILLVADETSLTKSVLTRFVAPQNPSIDPSLVIKVIISNDSFIAIDPMKKICGTI